MVVGVGWLAHCWVSEGSDSSLPPGGGWVLVAWSARLVGLAGHWFVNSGREHLVAIREFKASRGSRTCICVCGCVVCLVFVLFLL